jgi:hypothetical protein
MRYLLIILLIVFLIFRWVNQRVSPSSTNENPYSNSETKVRTDDSIGNLNEQVYICMSSTAYAYHKNRNCRGLRSCTHQVEPMTEKEAISQYRRKRCGYCYQ